ncbi:hypothetical protein BKH09_04000 [Actinomyces naeslundii]|nr:hypothetical protein BKH09_04000 [Actinomyces naeslundii]
MQDAHHPLTNLRLTAKRQTAMQGQSRQQRRANVPMLRGRDSPGQQKLRMQMQTRFTLSSSTQRF